MSRLFCFELIFNDDISRWNVSNVINMECMFHSAKSFNQPLDSWKIFKKSKVYHILHYALSFNKPETIKHFEKHNSQCIV